MAGKFIHLIIIIIENIVFNSQFGNFQFQLTICASSELAFQMIVTFSLQLEIEFR